MLNMKIAYLRASYITYIVRTNFIYNSDYTRWVLKAVGMKFLLFTLALLEITDGFLTNILIGKNIAYEVNPLLASIAGSPSLVAVKILGALLSVALLWHIHRSSRKLAEIATTCLVLVYSSVVAWSIFLL